MFVKATIILTVLVFTVALLIVFGPFDALAVGSTLDKEIKNERV